MRRGRIRAGSGGRSHRPGGGHYTGPAVAMFNVAATAVDSAAAGLRSLVCAASLTHGEYGAYHR
jgi:hypothetical protein